MSDARQWCGIRQEVWYRDTGLAREEVAVRRREASPETDSASLRAAMTRSGLVPMQFFREIRAYVGFEARDEELLALLRPVIVPHYEAIVASFYDALWGNPRTRMVFSGPEQVDRLQQTLLRWLASIFTGPYDEDYFAQRLRIGRVHVDVGLLPHFMFGAMNVIRRHIVGCVLESDALDEPTQREALFAVEKILDLELTIMVQSYWDVMMELKLQVPAALATGLAHEIRNPLNALNLNVTLMERRLRGLGVDTESIDPILEVMRSEIRRVRGLTSEIMDFAKPIAISAGWCDARELVRDLVMIHGPTLEVSQIELRTHVVGEPMMWCDTDRIKQVLVNLMTNAIEAIGDGGSITLTIEGDANGTQLVLEDTGEGMPPSLKYRIFDLFFTTKAAGTGLGLPIVRKIIEAHAGAIDVNSRPQQGTTFTIYLPKLATRKAPSTSSSSSSTSHAES